jgi:hypothetical protein
MWYRLARDPSARYFREAFAGMGVPETMLNRMDDEAHAHLPGPASWVPRIAAGVSVERAVGFDEESGRLVKGLALKRDSIREFTGNAPLVSALQAVNGKKTAQEIIESVLATLPAGERFPASMRLAASFVYAGSHGLLDAGPESNPLEPG